MGVRGRGTASVSRKNGSVSKMLHALVSGKVLVAQAVGRSSVVDELEHCLGAVEGKSG